LRGACREATTGNDTATMTSFSSNPPSSENLVVRGGCAVRDRLIKDWKAGAGRTVGTIAIKSIAKNG
jgi:hypothetical protein